VVRFRNFAPQLPGCGAIVWTASCPLLHLFSGPHHPLLTSEVGSRWDILEAAFSMRLPTETLATTTDAILRVDGPRRTPITCTRPVLHGYQNGVCFYCNEPLLDDIHVDHVIPWSVLHHDEIWNLVLAHGRCNIGKSDILPSSEGAIDPEDIARELADVLEVTRALAVAAGLTLESVETCREERVVSRGPFHERVFLVETRE
jgi:5-methylcytosine-specific restriction endonuclease McrA